MSVNKKTHAETIADIIAWLRKPREGENAYLTLWRDEIADRLEAAHKRERGDGAKSREAHWVGIKYDLACCSKCGADIYTHFDTTSQAKDEWGNLYPYCPNCGVQMDLTVPFEGKSRNKKTK